MKITIVSPVFPPEPVVSAATNFDIVSALVQRGHKVTVITAYPSRPGGRLYAGFSRRLFAIEHHPVGFRIVRCGSSISGKSTILSRGIQNITFGILSAVGQLIYGRGDAVFANTWPLFSAGCTALTSRICGSSLVLSVQDVYPESLLARSKFNAHSLVYQLMLGIDIFVARLANRVIVLSKDLATEYRFSRHLANGVVHQIPNWARVSDQPNEEAGVAYRRLKGIADSAFVIAYAGTFAESTGVDQLIGAAARRPFDRETVLLLAGDGACFEECRAMAEIASGVQFVFHRPYDPDDANRILGAADVLIVPTRGQISLTAVPSKMMHYMFAAKPVIAVCKPGSELAHIVAASGCGWAAEPDDVSAIAELLQSCSHSSCESLRTKGKAARKYACEHFSLETCLPRVIRLIEESATVSIKYRGRPEGEIAVD